MSALQARKTLTIGTRGSKLALAQAELVRAALLASHPGLDVRFQPITTRGDTLQDHPLSKIGGNGLFVRQIEEALRSGLVDLAVHSAKDLPSTLPTDMVIAAYLPRADVRDVLVSRTGSALRDLPPGARVGTSSPRRACLLASVRPDLKLENIRGNVDTRLRKLFDGQYDAIVLAAAGLARLGAADYVSEWLDPAVFIPAVGQGALAVEVRADDHAVYSLVEGLDDRDTSTAVRAERAFLARIGGGCALPVGVYAHVSGARLSISGMVGTLQGRVIRGTRTGEPSEPEQVGVALAEDILAAGGDALVRAGEDVEETTSMHTVDHGEERRGGER